MSVLVKAVFGMSGAEPHFTGYHTPGDTVNGWEMPCAEREVLEVWTAREGVDFEFFDDGTLLVRNIEGLDLREAGCKPVDLEIKPEELDTEDGVKTLYDLRELDWTFALADLPRPVKPVSRQEPVIGHGEIMMLDQQQIARLQTDGNDVSAPSLVRWNDGGFWTLADGVTWEAVQLRLALDLLANMERFMWTSLRGTKHQETATCYVQKAERVRQKRLKIRDDGGE